MAILESLGLWACLAAGSTGLAVVEGTNSSEQGKTFTSRTATSRELGLPTLYSGSLHRRTRQPCKPGVCVLDVALVDVDIGEKLCQSSRLQKLLLSRKTKQNTKPPGVAPHPAHPEYTRVPRTCIV